MKILKIFFVFRSPFGQQLLNAVCRIECVTQTGNTSDKRVQDLSVVIRKHMSSFTDRSLLVRLL